MFDAIIRKIMTEKVHEDTCEKTKFITEKVGKFQTTKVGKFVKQETKAVQGVKIRQQ